MLNLIYLQIALSGNDKHAPKWCQIKEDLIAATSAPLTSDTEQLLIQILQNENRLFLDTTAEQPHSMTPEDMLKSLAIQALAKWTGDRHLSLFRHLLSTANSTSLISIINAMIKRITSSKKL